MLELRLHPAHYEGDVQVAEPRVVVGYQLRPGDVARFTDWCTSRGVTVDRLATGGVMLSQGDTVIGRAELGDYAVDDGGVRVEVADGFYQRWIEA